MMHFESWFDKISGWKRKYPVCSSWHYQEKEINPYVFIEALSGGLNEDEVVFVDTGCAVAWLMQAYKAKKRQRVFHDFNNTAMGYALPASIGASIALDKKQIICVTGDGSLQMNIQELSSVIYHKLPIKIFLINNHGYSMIKQTQEQWLDSKYEASSDHSGLAFPNFLRVAKAYGFKTISITKNRSVPARIKEALEHSGPVFCNVEINPEHRVIPQVLFGRAIEDAEPFLDRKEFMENMIVKPDKASL